MSEDAQNKSHTGVWSTVAVVAVLVLYALSYGPVNVLAFKSHDPFVKQFVVIFYEPMSWVCRNTPLEDPMSDYYDWWMEPYEPPCNG